MEQIALWVCMQKARDFQRRAAAGLWMKVLTLSRDMAFLSNVREDLVG